MKPRPAGGGHARDGARVVGDAAGGGGVVAGEEDRGESEVAQLLDRFGRGRLHGVCDHEQRPDLAVPRSEDRGPGLRFSLGLLGEQCLAGGEAPVGEQRRATSDHTVPLDDTLDAEAFAVGERLDGRQFADLVGGAVGDRLGDGVL